ncbi:MAG: DUF4199 domain-containing protein, partial [Gemmatimonadaceae bacterium]
VLSFLLVYFGIRSHRDNSGGGSIRFGRAFAVGALITAISSLCYVATWELMFYKLTPDFGPKMAQAAIKQIEQRGYSPERKQEELDKARRFSELYQNPAINSAMTFLEPLPVGLIIALVSAGILSRKRGATGGGALEPSRVL